MNLSKMLKKAGELSLGILVLTPFLAWGEVKCPKSDSATRDAALKELFASVKPDPGNSDTIQKQDAIFDCLETLINATLMSPAGKKPDLKVMKSMVLWSAKSIQYKNDLYSAEFNGELSQKFFRRHTKLVQKALEALEKDKSLSAQEIKNFKEIL